MLETFLHGLLRVVGGIVHPGMIAQQRTWTIKPLLWSPTFAKVAIFHRWIYWAFWGWPATYGPVLLYLAAVWFAMIELFISLWPWVISWQVMSWWWSVVLGADRASAILLTLTGAAIGGYFAFRHWVRTKHKTILAVAKLVSPPALFGFVHGWTIYQIGHGWIVTAILFAPLVTHWFDRWLPAVFPTLLINRYMAQWNREVPTVWPGIASQTKSVQSNQSDGIEDDIADLQRRVFLTHPWKWIFWRNDRDDWASMQRVGPDPFRTLDALNDVLPAWSAHHGVIADHAESMTLMDWDGKSPGATSAVLKIYWRKPTDILEASKEMMLPSFLERWVSKLSRHDDANDTEPVAA